MSVRPGSVITLISPAAILGVSTGRVIALNNQFAVVPSGFFAYVASATVGTRGPILIQLLDQLGNILTQTAATTGVTAGQTPKLILMPGQPYTNIASPLSQILPWPIEMPAPVNASFRVVDNANIDVNDTVAANIAYAA